MPSIAALALSASLSVFQSTLPPPQVRDVRKEPAGTGVIAGVVQTDDAARKPLRRASVTISGDQLLTQRRVFANADGGFMFKDLPAGQYTVTASRISYMSMSYGSRRPGGPGAQIVLGSGQRMTDIALRLSRYGVITGTVYDQNGEPAQGISVEALRYTMRTGRRSLSSVYGQPAFTDDRGVYHLGGLEPGEYYIAAGPSPDNGTNDLLALSASDVDRALQTRPGGGATTPASRATSSHVTFAPIFFPGSVDLAGATSIALKLGEDRADVDLRLQLVPTARVEGTVTTPEGQPATSAQIVATMVTEAFSLDLFRAGTLGAARPDAQGRFVYPTLAPGRYVITARTASVTGPPGGTANVGPMWALSEIVVSGGADQSISLILQPGSSISGKVRFDGTALQPPSSLAGLRVSLVATQTTTVTMGASAAGVNPDGTFTISGAAPGLFRLTSTVPVAPAGWALRSVLVGGVDALDVPLEVKPGQNVDGVNVTFTDHPTVLSGALQTPTGVPTSDYFIIVFATDKSFWTPSTRRSVMARPSTIGQYVVRNLPPGEYFIAAVTDVLQGDWFDPTFLEGLVTASLRVTLAEGERKTQDLRVATGAK